MIEFELCLEILLSVELELLFFLFDENGLAPFAKGLFALCELDCETRSAILKKIQKSSKNNVN